MGNEASSENDRRARQRMLSYKQFVRDLHNLNSLWSVPAKTRTLTPSLIARTANLHLGALLSSLLWMAACMFVVSWRGVQRWQLHRSEDGLPTVVRSGHQPVASRAAYDKHCSTPAACAHHLTAQAALDH